MAISQYFGTYGRFSAPETDQGIHLMSADSLIGDELVYSLRTENGKTRVVLSNRFGGEIGVLDAESASEVQLCAAKEWDVHILLASVFQVAGAESMSREDLGGGAGAGDAGQGAGSEAGGAGASVRAAQPKGRAKHWGEVLILAWPTSKANVFNVFRENISKMLGEGVRPEVNLQQSAVSQILESGGTWTPTGRRAVLEKPGSVLVKSQLTVNDKLVEQARKRNPGCMIVGWAFIAALVLLAVYLVKLFLGF